VRVKTIINGWINLHKPLGMSSAAAVGKVKCLLRPQKSEISTKNDFRQLDFLVRISYRLTYGNAAFNTHQ